MNVTPRGYPILAPLLALPLLVPLLLSSPAVHGYNAEDWTGADQVYQKVCGHCHETGIGPRLTGRALPPAYIELMVRNGNRAMPAFRQGDIGDETLKELAQLISSGDSPLSQR